MPSYPPRAPVPQGPSRRCAQTQPQTARDTAADIARHSRWHHLPLPVHRPFLATAYPADLSITVQDRTNLMLAAGQGLEPCARSIVAIWFFPRTAFICALEYTERT